MNSNLFIPSYFGPKGSNLRERRKELHTRQLNWLLSGKLFDKIYVASQDYDANDYIEHEKIVYLNIPPHNPATARNTLLEKLDQTGGIGFFIDNDHIALVDIDLIISVAQSSLDWDMIGLTYIGSKERNNEVPENFIFKRMTSFATCGFAIKAGLGVRFDEALDDMEDKEFAIGLMLRHKLRYYQISNCTSWFYYNEVDSTLYATSSERGKKYKVALQKIRDKYQKEITELGGTDHVSAVRKLSYPSTLILSPQLHKRKSKVLF